MNRPSVFLFIGLAFAIAWAIWSGVAALALPRNVIELANFAPAAAAVLVRGPLRREGFRDAGLSPFRGRGLIPTYAIAYLVPALFFIGLGALALLSGVARLTLFERISQPATQFSGVRLAAQFGLAPLLLLVFLGPLLLALETAGEEIGWRGHLLVRLLPLGTAPAIFGTGIVWAIWHLPFNVLYAANGGLAGFPVFLGFAVLFGAFLSWLRLRSDSVWPAAVAHAALNGFSSFAALALTV